MVFSKQIHNRRRVKPKPFVAVEVLGPVQMGCFAAGELEVVVYHTKPEPSYALANQGNEPVQKRLVTEPISSFGANLLAFELLANGFDEKHREAAVMALAAWVFGSQLDNGGADRQRKHLEALARDHGFGEE